MDNLVMQLSDILHYAFMQRALIAGSCIALSCSFLGVFLVLRQSSLIGDGLAHVSFATIALGLLVGAAPIAVSIPLVILASLAIMQLADKKIVHSDAAIGLLSALGIATGVILASIAGGFNVDLFSYLFGNILAITRHEMWLSVILSVGVTATVALFYHDLFAVSFDEEYARVSGVRITAINRVLAVLIALTVVLGIKVVGTLLVSSLIIFPAVSALQFAKSFRATIVLAGIFSIVSVFTGIAISYSTNIPTGAMIVMVNFFLFIIAGSIRLFRR